MKLFILVQAESPTDGVHEAVRALPGVDAAHRVSGPFDVIVEADSLDGADLAADLVPAIRSIPGVIRVLPTPAASAAVMREPITEAS